MKSSILLVAAVFALQLLASVGYAQSGKNKKDSTTISPTSVLPVTEPPCIQWTGPCNSNDLIYRMGKVGIGTSDPGSFMLAVEGKIGAREIHVRPAGTSWADYVFECNYNLRPLEEVEAYIKKNKHLPDVPSAKEVEEKGLNLAESDATLLRKIEELTLYMIELKKQNEELKKRVEELEKR